MGLGAETLEHLVGPTLTDLFDVSLGKREKLSRSDAGALNRLAQLVQDLVTLRRG